MSLLLITYDFKDSSRDYKMFHDCIKNNCSTWWHYMDTVWIIKTSDTVDSLSNKLNKLIDQNTDYFMVIDVTGRASQGWLPKAAWDWLQKP